MEEKGMIPAGTATEDNLQQLSQEIGITWQNPDLLRLALTHPSYVYDHQLPPQESNQRLEFLGDAVLQLAVSSYLYEKFPSAGEGELTRLRAAVVCEPTLARVARSISLGEYLRLGRGEERTGGRNRPSILADAWEALVGAVYLDRGWEAARYFIIRYLEPWIEAAARGELDMDFKTALQEVLQRGSAAPITYIIMDEKGPAHDRTFTAGVMYRGQLLGVGEGHSKKEAEQQAARQALQKVLSRKAGNDYGFSAAAERKPTEDQADPGGED